MQLQLIKTSIRELRGERVILDFDLSKMYAVETRALKQAVRRNKDRFPEDFMFQLSKREWTEVITKCDNLPDTVKYSPSTPFAFTEQGVSMLSSVLKSKKAIQVNISIMRAFVLLRKNLADYKELKKAISALELDMDTRFRDINQVLNHLLNREKQQLLQRKRSTIGYKQRSQQSGRPAGQE